MAGLQCFCRKLFINNTSRLFNKKDVLLQPNRRRLHVVFQNSSPLSRLVFQKSKLLFEKDKQLIYRLASTNVSMSEEAVSDVNSKNLETTNESIQLKSESGVVASNSNVVLEEKTLPTAPIGDVTEVPAMEFVSTGLKEPSFESLELGSWWPPGIIQQILEFLHINCDLPWWQAIVAITVISRLILFPINLSVRRDTIVFANHLPAIKKFQEKITEARRSGDYYSVAEISQEMQKYIQDNNVNMLSFVKTAVVQGPVFLSMYWALRGMAELPVESLKTGGLFWFTDLSACDPYFILPVTLSTSLFIIMELGIEGNPAGANSHIMKWILRVIPIVILVVSSRFSACITFYWTISNLFALCQAAFLKIPAVAKFFKFPSQIKHQPDAKSVSTKGFIEGFKDGFLDAQITSQLEDRRRANLIQFQKAGNSPIPRTFKRNPVLEKTNK